MNLFRKRSGRRKPPTHPGRRLGESRLHRSSDPNPLPRAGEPCAGQFGRGYRGQYIVEDGKRIDRVRLVPQGPGKMEGEPTGTL
jgi:hypothetical protein